MSEIVLLKPGGKPPFVRVGDVVVVSCTSDHYVLSFIEHFKEETSERWRWRVLENENGSTNVVTYDEILMNAWLGAAATNDGTTVMYIFTEKRK
jgi:hypothetical protein